MKKNAKTVSTKKPAAKKASKKQIQAELSQEMTVLLYDLQRNVNDLVDEFESFMEDTNEAIQNISETSQHNLEATTNAINLLTEYSLYLSKPWVTRMFTKAPKLPKMIRESSFAKPENRVSLEDIFGPHFGSFAAQQSENCVDL